MLNKRRFLTLSAALLLSLTACGKGGNNQTATVTFNPIEDNCMVNPKAKKYIDAMKEQEKKVEFPYRLSPLFGPEDYERMAAKADTNDGVKYSAEDTGGVDVCQYLSRNDYSNDCKNYPITVSWDATPESFTNAKVAFWSKEDKSDLREVAVKSGATSAKLDNLYRATKYKYQLVNYDEAGENQIGASNIGELETGDYPRTITMGDIHNVRDIGGFQSAYGGRLNQGLMYRGYYIDDKSGGHGKNYTKAAGQVQAEVMKIGCEIDLQKSSETNGRKKSCLEGADYVNLMLISYENFINNPESYENLPAVMELMANSDQKHTYFHCWGGADRTGMLAFFILAICGVSYTDCLIDFELTTQTNNKRCHMHNSSSAHFPKFLDAFVKFEGFDANKSLNYNCQNVLLKRGVSMETIEKIRTIMIPGYKAGTPIPEQTEPLPVAASIDANVKTVSCQYCEATQA